MTVGEKKNGLMFYSEMMTFCNIFIWALSVCTDLVSSTEKFMVAASTVLTCVMNPSPTLVLEKVKSINVYYINFISVWGPVPLTIGITLYQAIISRYNDAIKVKTSFSNPAKQLWAAQARTTSIKKVTPFGTERHLLNAGETSLLIAPGKHSNKEQSKKQSTWPSRRWEGGRGEEIGYTPASRRPCEVQQRRWRTVHPQRLCAAVQHCAFVVGFIVVNLWT